MAFFDVLLATSIDRSLTYESENVLQPGQIVLAPLRQRSGVGIVLRTAPAMEPVPFKIQPISEALPFCCSLQTLSFLHWVASYNLLPLGMIAKMMIPFSSESFLKILKKPTNFQNNEPFLDFLSPNWTNIHLTESQELAVQTLLVRENFAVDLIDGVTGSGKTEVYLSVIVHRLMQRVNKNQILILLPEIALTEPLVRRFEQYFKFKPDVWHSSTSPAQKQRIWEKAIEGKPLIVIGARSALFLPFKNLATIVVDEEHDPSYKQSEQGSYHARDMAIVRAKLEDIPILLSSATPSLETVFNIEQGKYGQVTLTSRFAYAKMPEVSLVDMRQELGRPILSNALTEAIAQALEKKEQTLLFVNQRGYAPVSLCKACGYIWNCPMCDVTLIEHRQVQRLRCHHCGFEVPIQDSCPECKQRDTQILLGIGTERVLETVNLQFAQARCLVLTSDTVSSAKAWKSALDAIYQGEVDIILGTQILAKGHHFPNLTVVGIIEADRNLSGCDLRANERTYQLLHQVSGRAGRESKPGRVFFQTYNPEHPLMKALRANNRSDFYAYELMDRRRHQMPPFESLIAILLIGKNEEEVRKEARRLAQTFPLGTSAALLGPAPAPIARLRGQFRYRLLIKAKKGGSPLQPLIKNWSVSHQRSVTIYVDVDPYEFL